MTSTAARFTSKQRRDVKAAILQPARHVRAHSANSNKSDVHIFLSLGRATLRGADRITARLDRVSPYRFAKNGLSLFFFSHSRQRAVPGTNNRLLRQRQNFLAIVSQCVLVGNIAAAHRAGKKRIAHDRDRAGKPGDDKRHSAGRMTRGQPRLDFERAHSKAFSFRDSFRTLCRLRSSEM